MKFFDDGCTPTDGYVCEHVGGLAMCLLVLASWFLIGTPICTEALGVM